MERLIEEAAAYLEAAAGRSDSRPPKEILADMRRSRMATTKQPSREVERRDHTIAELGRLIAGLHVPVSLGMQLGTATKAYTQVRDLIGDYGWSGPALITERLRRVLLAPEPSPDSPAKEDTVLDAGKDPGPCLYGCEDPLTCKSGHTDCAHCRQVRSAPTNG